MKTVFFKDKKRRQIEKTRLYRRFFLKYLLRKKYILNNFTLNYLVQNRLKKLSRDSSPVRISNRCIITGRSRGVYRKFKLSRINIRESALKGILHGIKKSSW